jgi:phthalate 4,5-dioxygenase oxygenase subunit
MLSHEDNELLTRTGPGTAMGALIRRHWIPGFDVQDQAVQESQGPIVDRSQERLGTSDTAIIQVRRRLMAAARVLCDDAPPPPGGNPRSFLVRSASVALAPGESWIQGVMPRVVVRAGDQLTLA